MSILPPFLQTLLLHPFVLPIILFVIFVYKRLSSSLTTSKNLPPSPPKLPILGNFHQLGRSVHHSLLSLSKQYGKLMLLHLGSKPTLVVSSAEASREIMKTHDIIFSNRPKTRIVSRIFYDYKDVAFANYGEDWRKRRSICVMHLLSNQKVKSFCTIREEEIALMVENIYNLHSSVVNLREISWKYTTDVLCRAAFGWKYSSNSEIGKKFKERLNEVMVLLGVFSVGNYVPWLSWIDRVTGLDSAVEMVAKDLDEILDRVLAEHEDQYHLSTKKDTSDESEKGHNIKNFVEILLEFHRENKDALSKDSIKSVILDIFAPGTDTTYTLIEWTMSELMKNPKTMKQVQEEVRKIAGGKGHRVHEDDLEKLIYLKAVVKEALRMHPPAPLLLYRESSQDVRINDFYIEAGTQVIINAYAIQRDPVYWEEPEKFRPERFLDSTTCLDYKGKDFQYIPFGGGRRICPGMSFSMVNAELVVANLVYEFDWKLPDGEDGEKLDMTENAGINVHKRVPLMVIATPYSCK